MRHHLGHSGNPDLSSAEGFSVAVFFLFFKIHSTPQFFACTAETPIKCFSDQTKPHKIWIMHVHICPKDPCSEYMTATSYL